MLSTTASYLAVSNNLTRMQTATANDPQVKNDTAYFLANIGKVTSISDFVNNYRLFTYAMKAFGLEDMDYAKGLMTKVLQGGVKSSSALANTLNNSAYKAFATAFDFVGKGSTVTQTAGATTAVVSKYVEQSLENKEGTTNQGVQLALYFQRNASSVTNAYGLLADPSLLKVVETAFGLPASTTADVDSLAKTLGNYVSVSDLQDPTKVQKIAERFTAMWDLAGNNTSSDISSISQIFASSSTSTGVSADLLLSLQGLRLGEAEMRGNLYVELSGEVALEKRLDTVATNLANVNTGGYRAQGVTFASVLSKAGERPASFVKTGTEYISRAQGAAQQTGSPFDLAIQGDSWFAIKTPGGTAYTRDGRFQMSQNGELQTINGYQVLDAGGASMLLSPDQGPPKIAADGMMTQNGNQVGAVGLFTLPDSATLSRYDNSAVVSSVPGTPVLDFSSNTVSQGFAEGSNVNPVLEITKLIQIQRAFDGLLNLQQTSESSQQDAIKTLGSNS